jgi:hypothetical protein
MKPEHIGDLLRELRLAQQELANSESLLRWAFKKLTGAEYAEAQEVATRLRKIETEAAQSLLSGQLDVGLLADLSEFYEANSRCHVAKNKFQQACQCLAEALLEVGQIIDATTSEKCYECLVAAAEEYLEKSQ